MKRYGYLFFLLSILASCFSAKNLSLTKIGQQEPIERTTAILQYLSSDELKGRKPGTPEFKNTANYIENELLKSKIVPFFNNSYEDTFQIKQTETYNIVGLIDSKKASDSCILLCAHYDHLGTKKSKKDSIYNGANDNASGVTTVLQIAELLANYHFNKKIIVAFFSGEEAGLVGSKHLAERLKQENVKLKYVLNFEMLGKTLTNGIDQVYITGFDISNLSEIVNKSMKKEFIVNFSGEKQQGLFYRSDNYPFYDQFNIPSHTISTFDFKNDPYYHNVKDEFAQLDLHNLNSIIHLSSLMVIKLLNEDKKLKLVK